jgi:hypothetical protein
MAINISEQFIVNVALPVDSRIVASNSTDRDAIVYKYDGLRVFLQDERKTYVWNESSSTWTLAELGGSGDPNYIARWSSSLGLTASPLYAVNGTSNVSGKVGINTNSPASEFQINGDGGSSQPFVVQKDNGTMIAHNWYNDGSDQFFNSAGGSGAVKFRSNGEIWILTRNGGTSAINSSDGDFTNASAVFRSDSISLTKNTTFNTGGSPVSSARIRATNSFSNAATPDYTWFGNDTTGFFHPSNNVIGITVGGTRRAIINATGFLLSQNTSISGPAARLHIDNGGTIPSIIKFTAGTTTGTGVNNGFDIGINTGGFPIFVSRYNNQPFLFNIGGRTFWSISRNNISYYPEGPSFNLENGTRIITGSIIKEFSGAATHTIGTFSVPNNSQVSVEATFVSGFDSGTPPKQFRNNKTVRQYTVNNSGSILEQPGSGASLYNLASSSSSGIQTGFIGIQNPNILIFQQQTSAGQSSLMVKYEISINTSFGH